MITVKLRTAVRRTFRVEQVAGMFDVALPAEGRRVSGSKLQVSSSGSGDTARGACGLLTHELTAEVPGVEEKWTIGAIVGPSGSGKTTLAKAAFGRIYKPRAWPRDRAIIDVLGDQAFQVPSSKFQVEGKAECGLRNAEWGQLSIKELTRMLVAVGLGSPPTWLKPYHVLSGGEKFRAELVRAVLRARGEGLGARGQKVESGKRKAENPSCGLVVIDEFSALLDRTVAKTASAAFARLLRWVSDTPQAVRLVAVTCHRDVLPWLSPDWVVELGVSSSKFQVSGSRSTTDGSAGTSPSRSDGTRSVPTTEARLIRGRPRKPSFRFTVERVQQAMWTRFSGEHYLSGGLAASASCYGAFIKCSGFGVQGSGQTFKVQGSKFEVWGPKTRQAGSLPHGEPIAFCAVVAALGWKQTKRIQRLVVLPEFQWMGIGGKLLDLVAAMESAKGFRVTITASHPAVLAHCARSERWRYLEIKKLGSTPQVMDGREIASSVGRAVAAFEFVDSPKFKVQGPRLS